MKDKAENAHKAVELTKVTPEKVEQTKATANNAEANQETLPFLTVARPKVIPKEVFLYSGNNPKEFRQLVTLTGITPKFDFTTNGLMRYDFGKKLVPIIYERPYAIFLGGNEKGKYSDILTIITMDDFIHMYEPIDTKELTIKDFPKK